MSRRKKDQLAAIYIVVLVLFGLALVLFALWVFCLLSGPDFGSCTMDALGPLAGRAPRPG